ncbi:DUF4381 domain-containing protein [Aromatoleum evansii]|uniref:DUF4381 domain-containing protein n=1 Tax=Aromatoleum evansii TaxID=59406 RepID=UPI00145D7DF7|nr:DUF4381 domain-containing protein [Aromatoleum evansii]NMG31979.1 DUF4381 family protein [Aromatoleum evansii]
MTADAPLPPSIDQLRDIHLPPPPDMWPPAPIVLLVALAVVLIAAWTVRRHRRQTPLRRALRELDALARNHAAAQDPVTLARGISRLLRNYARSRFPRENVARLAGADWLRFLDAHGTHGDFTSGPGRVLDELPYRPPGSPGEDADAVALLRITRQWLRRNAP